jgi:hypothetical protein
MYELATLAKVRRLIFLGDSITYTGHAAASSPMP